MSIDAINTWAMPMYDRDLSLREQTKPGAQGDAPSPGAAPEVAPVAAAPTAVNAGASGRNLNGEDQDKPAEQSLLERILERGFGQFVADMEKEKLAKMREEILSTMGLNEEMLLNMSPEQRQGIESAVANEIRRRLEALNALNSGGEKPHGEMIPTPDSTMPPTSMAQTAGAGAGAGVGAGAAAHDDGRGSGTGLGVLLALQEIEAAKAESLDARSENEPGKKDRDAL